MFAVFGALNGVRPTVAGSVRFLIGGLAGILLGTVLAVGSETLTAAPRALVVALLVALGLFMTVRLRVYDLMGTEIVVTALLVFALSQGRPDWALGRFAETALGGGIAIVINALLLPPDYGRDARDAVHVLVETLSTCLDNILGDLADPPPADVLAEHQAAALTASDLGNELVAQTTRAREALRFSPVLRYSRWRKAAPAEVDRYLLGIETVAFGLSQARSAARALAESGITGAVPGLSIDEIVSTSRAAVEKFGAYVLDGDGESLRRAERAIGAACAEHARVLARLHDADVTDVHRSVALAMAGHILSDLAHALDTAPRAS